MTKRKLKPGEKIDLARTFIADGGLFEGVRLLREATDEIEDFALEQRRRLTKMAGGVDGSSASDAALVEYAYTNPRDIIRDGIEILEAVMQERIDSGSDDEVLADLLNRMKKATGHA